MDCFAFRFYNNKFSCNALIKLDCDGCTFYKTKKQVELEQERTERRLKEISHYNKVVVNILK